MATDDILLQIDKCPHCGSDKRIGESLLRQVKERGLVGKDFIWYPVHQQIGPPIDNEHPPLVGTKLPLAVAQMDFCGNCGRIYTVRIIEGDAQVLDTQIGPMGRPRRNGG